MNRTLARIQAIEKGVVSVFGRVTFGSSGAPTLDTARSKGIASISRSSTGTYVITLSEPVQKLLIIRHLFLNATAPASPSMYLKTDAVSTTPAVTVVFNSAGTATDPASGEEVRLELVLKNSSV